MDPNPNKISPSSDIRVLFNANLRLKNDPKVIEQKLRQNGITTLGHLTKLAVTDLMHIGIDAHDAEVLLNHARRLCGEPEKLEFKDVTSWLKAFRLERYESNFDNIPMKMVPFIRRSDLTANLGIPPTDTPKVWNALQQLKKTFPPPIQTMDDKCELICTTTESPITVDLNETNLSEMLAHADKQKSSIKVSFVGDTGSEKSLLITQLLKFDDRIRAGRGPLVATPGQLEATTGNVCLYATTSRDGKYNFLLLDFEGAFVGTPRRLKEQWGKQWEHLATQYAEHLKHLNRQREEVVKTIFPQLAYLISNIVVLIDKQPPHHTGYVEKLTKFAELSTINSGTGEKPFLMIIQNFANPENQREKYDSYKIEQSTTDFNECIQRQKKTQELLQHYRDICFIRLPSWTAHPLLFDQQICLIQEQLVKYAMTLEKHSWFAKNFWNDYLWFSYVKTLCNELKRTDRELNVPKIIASLIQPHLTPFHRILNFWFMIWTPPVVGKETDKVSIESKWETCCNIALERFVGLFLDDLQSRFDEMKFQESENSATLFSCVHNLFMKDLQSFSYEILRFSPCLHKLDNDRLCGIARDWHTSGHYGIRTGSHEGPEFPKEFFTRAVENMNTLLPLNYAERLEVYLSLMRKGLQLKSSTELNLLLQTWLNFCVVCLKPFTITCTLFMMDCNHAICPSCSVLSKRIFCPIHG